MDEKKSYIFTNDETNFLKNCRIKNKIINSVIASLKINKIPDYGYFVTNFFKKTKQITFNFSNDTYTICVPENDYISNNINDDFIGTINPIMIIFMIITDHSKFYINMNDIYYKFLEIFFLNLTDIMYWTNKLHIDEILVFIEEIFQLRQPLQHKLPNKFEVIENLGGMDFIDDAIETELNSYCSKYTEGREYERHKIYSIISKNNPNESDIIHNLINKKYNCENKVLKNVSAMINRIGSLLINRNILRLKQLDLNLIIDYFNNKDGKNIYVFSIFMYYQMNLLKYPFTLDFNQLNDTEINKIWLKHCEIFPEYLSDMVKSNLFLLNQL